MTDDGEAIGENVDNSRRNPRPRYRRRLIRRPRTTSSQQTNRLENLPSSGTNRKSPNPASSSATSIRSVIDIPPESYDNSTKVYYWFFSFLLKTMQLGFFMKSITDDCTDLRTFAYNFMNCTVKTRLQSPLEKKRLLYENLHQHYFN